MNIDLLNRTACCPIFIGNKYCGKGYATEARMLILKYAFYERGLLRITDYVIEDNIASLKLHEKCGYKQEGIMRKAVFKNGKFINQYVLGCLKEDFDKLIDK